MKTLVLDLEPGELRCIPPAFAGDMLIIEKKIQAPSPCVGCFG